MTTERSAVLGIGSNVGSREAYLRAAVELLREVPKTTVEACSQVWETEPMGPPQGLYLNAAVRLRTGLEPEALLAALQELEHRLDRERTVHWGPRTLDLDLLWMEDCVREGTLSLPHPGLWERAFAMVPMVEVCPTAREPRTGRLYADRAPALGEPGRSVLSWRESFPVETLEHTADEGFRVQALDFADLLAAAAEALGGLMVEARSVRPRELRRVVFESSGEAALDEVLHGFLSEVLYHMDAKRFAIRRVVVAGWGPTGVQASLLGETLEPSRHEVHGALKAVTWHCLEVHEGEQGPWTAQVVVDV